MNTVLPYGLFMLQLCATAFTQNSSYLLVETSSRESEGEANYLVVKKDDGRKILIKLNNKPEYEGEIDVRQNYLSVNIVVMISYCQNRQFYT